MRNLIMVFCGAGSKLYELHTNLFTKVISSLVSNLGVEVKTEVLYIFKR